MSLYRRKGTFFVSQVVLTPKASTVMKGVASGLRETITERCVLCVTETQRSVCVCVPYVPTVVPESAWHFEAKSCGVLASTCTWRRLVSE